MIEIGSYLFIAINPRSMLTSVSVRVPCIGQIDLFRVMFKMILKYTNTLVLKKIDIATKNEELN